MIIRFLWIHLAKRAICIRSCTPLSLTALIATAQRGVASVSWYRLTERRKRKRRDFDVNTYRARDNN